jgi:alpha-beta hydrolase superfamily lysophospholipase
MRGSSALRCSRHDEGGAAVNSELIPVRDGVELYVGSWPNDRARATLVIVHGISEHLGRWTHVADFFGGRGYEVVAYDLRGHGKSGGPLLDVATFEQYLDDLEVVIQRARKPRLPLVVYGHSMGGLIATLYAESTRPQPDVYVLSAPALDADVPGVLRVLAKVLPHVAPKLRVPSNIRGGHLSRDPDVAAAYFSDPLVYVKPTTRLGGALLVAGARARKDVGSISKPALVIHGADDELVPPRASAPLAASPFVERRLFPGLRHEMHNEPEQEEVLGFVSSWLDAHIPG